MGKDPKAAAVALTVAAVTPAAPAEAVVALVISLAVKDSVESSIEKVSHQCFNFLPATSSIFIFVLIQSGR